MNVKLRDSFFMFYDLGMRKGVFNSQNLLPFKLQNIVSVSTREKSVSLHLYGLYKPAGRLDCE